MKILNLFATVLIVFLCSCSSAVHFQTETFRAAQTMLPAINKKIVLVDNALQQPDSVGTHIYKGNVIIDSLSVSKDSVKVNLMSYLADQFYNSGFFEDVLIYTLPMRTDNSWNSVTELTLQQQDLIYSQTGADWILSLDYLSSDFDIITFNPSGQALFSTSMKLTTQSLYSIYKEGASKYEKRYLIADTLTWQSFGFDVATSYVNLPEFKPAIEDGLYWNADKSSKTWIPYKQIEERFFVKSSNPAMREADELRAKGRYEDASYMWEYVYENYERAELKMYSAYNLAIYYESINDYEKSIEWLDKSMAVAPAIRSIGSLNFASYKKYLLERKDEQDILRSQIPFLSR